MAVLISILLVAELVAVGADIKTQTFRTADPKTAVPLTYHLQYRIVTT
jgi:hypothetical protein